jgi:flagellar assembly protein FliH
MESDPEPAIRPFPYAELPPQTVVAGSVGEKPPGPGYDGRAGDKSGTLAQREADARDAGHRDGEVAARQAFESRLGEIREDVRAALAAFAGERATYYQQVEAEVVQLALGIARKILHREAQIDPLLLAGMVRVALEKIESGTKVVVRVHPHQVSECRTYFAQHMEPRDVPEVIEDPSLAMDHCALQTALGTTELGLEVQLKELEQGLFDLMERRPPGGA